uniref:Immunoglobulin V-set domain-containing protein n=1 Tax=Laticauda laticaudata TaxID=8630 RepID=A0A8C5RFZ7_LATLA
MERQAEGGRRRLRDPPGWTPPWRAVLLAASILSSSFLLAQGQLSTTTFYNISISRNPPETLEGQTVNLTLEHTTANFALCSWYREIDTKEHLIVTLYLPPIVGNTTGPSHTGREVAGFGCSLLIKNLHLDDTGTYVVTMNGPSVDGKGDIKIQVLDESSIQSRMSPAAIAGTTIGSVAGMVLCMIVVYFLCTKASCWKKEQHASNGNIPSAPGHNQATDTKSKPGEEDIQYSTLAFNTKNTSQPLSKSPRPLDSGIIYSEIKKK